MAVRSDDEVRVPGRLLGSSSAGPGEDPDRTDTIPKFPDIYASVPASTSELVANKQHQLPRQDMEQQQQPRQPWRWGLRRRLVQEWGNIWARLAQPKRKRTGGKDEQYATPEPQNSPPLSNIHSDKDIAERGDGTEQAPAAAKAERQREQSRWEDSAGVANAAGKGAVDVAKAGAAMIDKPGERETRASKEEVPQKPGQGHGGDSAAEKGQSDGDAVGDAVGGSAAAVVEEDDAIRGVGSSSDSSSGGVLDMLYTGDRERISLVWLGAEVADGLWRAPQEGSVWEEAFRRLRLTRWKPQHVSATCRTPCAHWNTNRWVEVVFVFFVFFVFFYFFIYLSHFQPLPNLGMNP